LGSLKAVLSQEIAFFIFQPFSIPNDSAILARLNISSAQIASKQPERAGKELYLSDHPRDDSY